jgi:hypothetical protein
MDGSQDVRMDKLMSECVKSSVHMWVDNGATVEGFIYAF